MSYGNLTPAQWKALKQYVDGVVVHDLGAGQLELAHETILLGANQVIAIDKDRMPVPHNRRIKTVRSYFADYKEPIDTALVSWPINRVERSLLELLRRARIVIYIGKNTDGLSCGWPHLFLYFLSRELLEYVPDSHNVLAVYGKPLDHMRRPTGEELAAIRTYEKMYSYDEAEADAVS